MSTVQVRLPLGVSHIWAVACPRPSGAGLQYDSSLPASSTAVVALPTSVSPLTDDEAQLEMSFRIKAPATASENPSTRAVIAAAVQDAVGTGGAVVKSLEVSYQHSAHA